MTEGRPVLFDVNALLALSLSTQQHHNEQVTDLHLVDLAARARMQLATFDAAIPTWVAPGDRSHVVLIPS